MLQIRKNFEQIKAVNFVWFSFFLFLLFLPLYEAPKNIFSVLFVGMGLLVALNRGSIYFCMKQAVQIKGIFLFLCVSTFLAGMFSSTLEFSGRISNALNWALMPMVTFVFLLINPSELVVRWGLRSLNVGTVLAILQAISNWTDDYPQLNSVGHVNQSALYLAFAVIPAGLLYLKRKNLWDIALASLVIVGIAIFQGPARSMVGFGLCALAIVGFFCIHLVRVRRKGFLLGVMLCSVAFSISFVVLPAENFGIYEGFKRELDMRLTAGADFANREKLLRSSVLLAGDSVFGNGISSFKRVVTESKLSAAIEDVGGEWEAEKSRFFVASHGHGLFSTVLVERGWFGVSAVALFLALIVRNFTQRPRGIESDVGLLTVILILVGGLGQTTLHVEHGQLALLCLGISYSLTNT